MHRFNRLIWFMAAIGVFLLSSFSAYGRVYLDIDSPAFHKYPIAITDFKKINEGPDTEKLAAWFSDSLGNLLNIAGFFNIIDKKAFLESPTQSAQYPEAVSFPDWSAIGAEYLIKGGFSLNKKDLVAEFRLYDVVKGEILVGKRYTAGYEDRVAVIKKFADEVLYALTGEKGIFDSRIAFVMKKGDKSDIYTIAFDGSSLTRVTNHNALMISPRWSPDGRHLSFTSFKDGNSDLYLMDLSNSRISKLAGFRGLNLSGYWSPDGGKLLMTLSRDGNEEIYAMDMASRRLQRLTQNYAIDVSPSWSPDGKKIAFVSNRSGSPQIYVMDADGGNVNRISYEGNYNTAPAWSPKGGRIAYIGRSDGRFQIFTMKEDGSEPAPLTRENGDCESPSWSPDGRYVAFSQKAGKRQTICVINANGTNKRVLFGGKEGYVSPSWSPR
ncbi:MAG: Tol-Pal system beta propeller repeat protein TolB [Deltaproteobacteria bacterium]|nr:Tol-Pal system beta propeller repeat protein TolB [Deltaproteobacteria bacterium]